MGRLAGKTAVVTGGGQGIGRGISDALLKEGASILIAQRSPLEAELDSHQKVHWVKADLADPGSFEQVASESARRLKRVDILVNNAGFMFERTLQEMSLDEWNRMIAVNLTAPAFLSQAMLPLLRQSRGNIINIGSIEGVAANPEHAAYCASKAGVHGLTQSLAVDLGADGIRVNAIAPGWIRSDLSDDYIDSQADPAAARAGLNKLHPIGRVGEPADIGNLAVYLASDDAAFITGQVIVADGGRMTKIPLPF